LVAAIVLAVDCGWSDQGQKPEQSASTGQNAASGQKPQKFSASAIQIERVDSGAVALPPDFRLALYENLIEEAKKTGKFQRVYRSGEQGAADVPGLVVLRATTTGFMAGSERKREVTTIAGATSIKVRVQITNRDGQRLVDREVEGKVRFFGANLRATYDLSKKVAKIVRQTF
jgi:hypothetical protein